MDNQSVFQKLMGFINKAGTAVMMNLLFLAACLPVVTIGPAWSGIYGAVRFTIRGDSWFDGFKEGYKCHFWRNMIGWTFGAAVAGYACYSLYGHIGYLVAGNPVTVGAIVPLVVSAIVALAALLVVAIMLPLGMYFPQLDANTWLVTTWDVILHAPLHCLGVVAVMWLPLGMFLFAQQYFAMFAIVFVAVYYILAALVATMLLKNPLLRILKRYPREEE